MTAERALSAREIFELICREEERHNLFEHELDGWCVWPIFRKIVGDRLANLQHDSAAAGAPSRKWILKYALADVAKLARLKSSPTLVKTYITGLLDRDPDGRFRDIWFDDLLVALGDGVKIEALNSRAFLSRRDKRVWPDDLTTSLASIVTNSIVPRLPASRKVRRVASELGAAMNAAFGPIVSAASIESVLAGFEADRVFYGRVLKWVRPKRVLTADFGEYALTSVAREAGIPVLELQHGVTDRFHPAYSWTQTAVPFSRKMLVADRLLLYGEAWKEEMDVSGFWGPRLEVTGSLRIDRWRSFPVSRRRDAILITTQGIQSAAIALIIRECVTAADDVEILVKLHPVFTGANDELRALLADCPRVEIMSAAAEAVSTLELLRTVRLHASVSSATHYDSLGVGTPTAVLALPWHEVVLPLVERGHATLVSDGRGLLEAFRSARDVTDEIGTYYFAKDAVRRTTAAVENAVVS
jgi:hypothetical protein